MGLRNELLPRTGLEGIVQASNDFRQAMQANADQEQKLAQAEQMRQLAAQAPDLLSQPNGSLRLAAMGVGAGHPELLGNLIAARGTQDLENQQGLLNQEQSDVLPFSASEKQVIGEADTAKKQKTIMDALFEKQKLDATLRKEAADKAAKQGDFKKDQADAAGYYIDMETADKNINDVIKRDPTLISRLSTKSVLNAINAPEAVKDPELKIFASNVQRFINAKGRRESGMRIDIDEFERWKQIYLPTSGDKEKNLSQKQEARYQAMGAMRTAATDEATFEALPTNIAF